MRQVVLLAARFLVVQMFLGVGRVFAGNTATMRVTIRVEPINVVGVEPQVGSITLGETGTNDLKWTANEDNRKILVRLDHKR